MVRKQLAQFISPAILRWLNTAAKAYSPDVAGEGRGRTEGKLALHSPNLPSSLHECSQVLPGVCVMSLTRVYKVGQLSS